MAEPSVIVGTDGRPLSWTPRRGARASVPGPDGTTTIPGLSSSVYPYNASSYVTQGMGDWQPVIRSPDSEINIHRDRMVARSRDLARNSGWASGGVTRILDNTIGTHLRLSATPDYRALAQRFGIKAFDAEWAEEFRLAAEALWRGYSESVGRWSDVTRQLTLGQMFRLAMRHKLIDGESEILVYWLEDRVNEPGAGYATSFLLIDPDRVTNPSLMMDNEYMRGGVELDELGVPVAHHIRKAQPNDWYNAAKSFTWERVPIEDPDGWRRVIHDFERDRADQHRGIGIFIPVLEHMRMLGSYYGVELQAATLAATLGTYVTSPYDPALVQDALGADDDTELAQYQELRSKWANERPALFGGVRVPTLAPGEKIEAVASQHPHGNFAGFAHEMLCVFAAATGVSVEQVTQDWSKTNYSSARAALMETWKTLMRRRGDFCVNTATPMYAAWLWEAMDRGELPLPAGAPAFSEAPTAYSRARWLGPARGWVDPVKEPEGAMVRMASGTSTLESEAAEQGVDWEEVLAQRAIEQAAYKEAGVEMPEWVPKPQEKKSPDPEGSHDPTSPNYRSKGGPAPVRASAEGAQAAQAAPADTAALVASITKPMSDAISAAMAPMLGVMLAQANRPAAPVNVHAHVAAPPPAQVHAHMPAQPAPVVHTHVAAQEAPVVNVTAQASPPVISVTAQAAPADPNAVQYMEIVSMPKRTTATVTRRDSQGRISEVSHTEEDAK